MNQDERVSKLFIPRVNKEMFQWLELFESRLETFGDASYGPGGSNFEAATHFIDEIIKIIIRRGGRYKYVPGIVTVGAKAFEKEAIPFDFSNASIDMILATLEFARTHSVAPDTVASD